MFRILFYLVFLIALSTCIAWLASAPGRVSIVWQDYELTTTAAFLLLAVFALMTASAMLFGLWRFLVRAPRRFRRKRQERHYAKGLQAVTESLVAISTADKAQAKQLNARARKYLGNKAITRLLDAQVARLEQDEGKIHQALEAMLDYPETRALAARNLAEYNLRKGNLPAAEAFGRQAQSLQPRKPESCKELLGIYIYAKDWEQAAALLDRCRWQGLISRAQSRTWRAMLHLARGRALLAEENPKSAAQALHEVFHLQPAYVPAALAYAKMLQNEGRNKEALNVIKKAWKETPHPLLADAVVDISQTMPPAEALKIARRLMSQHMESTEGKLLMARLSMRAKEWNIARDFLLPLAEKEDNSRALLTLAELEHTGYQDSEAEAKWALKAAHAPLPARWHCDVCGHEPAMATPCCPECHSFDSIIWVAPAKTLPPPKASRAL